MTGRGRPRLRGSSLNPPHGPARELNFRIPDPLSDRFDAERERLDLTPSQMGRRCIEMALDMMDSNKAAEEDPGP